MKTANFFSLVFNVLNREFKRIFERKTIFLFLIILPPILYSFFILIYDNKTLRNIPVAIVDKDDSELSRLFIRYLDASPNLKVKYKAANLTEIESLFKYGKIYCAVLIDKDFESNIKKGLSSTITIYKNSRNLIISNLVYKELNTIARTLSTGILIKKFSSKTKNYDRAYSISNQILIETHYIYNPYYNYQLFLMPGLLPAMLHMIIMIVSSLLITSEIDHNTICELNKAANFNSIVIFIGKFIPHFIINALNSLILTSIIFAWIDIPLKVNFASYFISLLFLSAVSISLGIFLSCLFGSQMLALEAAIFLSTPAFIYSGYTFPNWAMPYAHQFISFLLPYYHFMKALYKTFYVNNDFINAIGEFLILLAYIFSFSISSILLLKSKLDLCHEKTK